MIAWVYEEDADFSLWEKAGPIYQILFKLRENEKTAQYNEKLIYCNSKEISFKMWFKRCKTLSSILGAVSTK